MPASTFARIPWGKVISSLPAILDAARGLVETARKRVTQSQPTAGDLPPQQSAETIRATRPVSIPWRVPTPPMPKSPLTWRRNLRPMQRHSLPWHRAFASSRGSQQLLP